MPSNRKGRPGWWPVRKQRSRISDDYVPGASEPGIGDV
jgi:hypothetical protein